LRLILTGPAILMGESANRFLNQLSVAAQQKLINEARDTEPVSGLTHNFYKYPARFSPAFARAAIGAFTRPGGLILDPYVGGGTTLVEALATGRNAVGVDISTLAEFVSRVKTRIYSEAELNTLQIWSRDIAQAIDMHGKSVRFADYAASGYYKHLDDPDRWRLRKAIEQGLWSAIQLGRPRLESFARCVVLRAAQWALDGRSRQASIDEFRQVLQTTAAAMVEGARELRAAMKGGHGRRPNIEIINRSAAGLERDWQMRGWSAPKLVLTSPPYPGVHVLYHRWQVDGRKETPLPFMIANKLDGAFESFYTMGDRRYPQLKTYFENISTTMTSVVSLANQHTIVVQMVAFSDRSWQLPRYLETMEKCGLQELFLPALKGQYDGRLWRSVPGRRWYSDQRGDTPASNEVVLIHRKSPTTSRRRLARWHQSCPGGAALRL
jgi:DNA methylase